MKMISSTGLRRLCRKSARCLTSARFRSRLAPLVIARLRPRLHCPFGNSKFFLPNGPWFSPRGRRRLRGCRPNLAVSFFMTAADLAIVNVALPTIGRKLHMPESSLQWVVTGYALTFGGFLLLGGRAADLLGRRRILMAGLAVFTASSLGCGLATADSVLIPMRFLQGLGAAIVLPAALSIVMNMFPEGAERNKALGVGGHRSERRGRRGDGRRAAHRYVGWQYIFFLNVPIGAAALLLARASCRRAARHGTPPLRPVRRGRRDRRPVAARLRDFDRPAGRVGYRPDGDAAEASNSPPARRGRASDGDAVRAGTGALAFDAVRIRCWRSAKLLRPCPPRCSAPSPASPGARSRARAITLRTAAAVSGCGPGPEG